jgi:hypothetical protein
MSMIPRSPTDTSVTFSLAELAKIEAERVREEDARRARARDREAREKREAEEARRAAETAEAVVAAEARARRLREEAEEKARLDARQRAEIEVARIAADAKARLDEANAQRAHEIAMLKVRTEGGARRLRAALAAVIGLALAGGAAAAYGVDQHVGRLARETEQIRAGQQALAQEREQAKATELSALDRRFAALSAHPSIKDAEEPRAAAAAARRAVDDKALDHHRLQAFGDALDALQGRLVTLDRLALLDRRLDDLGAWAGDRRRPEALAAARAAGTRARAIGSDDALRVYEGALDQARMGIAGSAGSAGRPVVTVPTTDKGPKGTCSQGDPCCDIDGHRTC